MCARLCHMTFTLPEPKLNNIPPPSIKLFERGCEIKGLHFLFHFSSLWRLSELKAQRLVFGISKKFVNFKDDIQHLRTSEELKAV